MSSSVGPFSRTAKLYLGKSTLFKSFLLLGVAAISALFIWYSFGLIEELKKDTSEQVEKYAKLFQIAINSPNTSAEMQFIFDEIIIKANFPIIVLDTRGNPVQWRNIPEIGEGDTSEVSRALLGRMAKDMQENERAFPIYYGAQLINHLCYGEPALVGKLQLMPFVQIGVVIAFLTAGLIGFHHIRRSEERLLWVGMAKETAHQLGTPISSLLGWLELFGRENRANLSEAQLGELLDKTVENMSADAKRLQRIANRFGQIGSVPERVESNLNHLVAETVEYFKRRLPFEGKGTRIEFRPGKLPPVELNPELFTWALENLIKNGLQAVDPKYGLVEISTSMSDGDRKLQLLVADNGAGISAAQARKIFRPGFTTKKRGWGIGLTLVKRIVEEYHGGRIILKRSHVGETVFEILLPADSSQRQSS